MYGPSLNYSDLRIDRRPAGGRDGAPPSRAEIDLRVAGIRRRGRIER